MEKSSASFLAMNFILLFSVIAFILIVFELQGISFVFELGILLIFMFLLVFSIFVVYNNKKWGWTVLGATLVLLLLNIFFIFVFTGTFETAHTVATFLSIVGLIIALLNMRETTQGYYGSEIGESDKVKEYYPYIDKMEPKEETKAEIKQELKKEIREELKEEQKKESHLAKAFTPGKFVASKKANKFHSPKCDWAKRIDKANQIWFNSEQEAKSQGFEADRCV